MTYKIALTEYIFIIIVPFNTLDYRDFVYRERMF